MFSDLLFFLMIISPLLIPAFVAVSALSGGSYQKRDVGRKKIFLAPVSAVVFPITIFVWFAVEGVFLANPGLFTSWRSVLSEPGTITALLAAVFLIAGIYWGVIRWYQKECALVLDLERRTYRTIDMGTVKLKGQTGSWDEIGGIYVKRTSSKGNVVFYVRLAWKRQLKLNGLMGGFAKREQADAFAARMAKELELPLVAAPVR